MGDKRSGDISSLIPLVLLSLVTGRGKDSLHPKREEQKCHEVGGGEKNVQQCAAQFFLVFPHIFREKNKMSWKRRETLEHPTDQVSSPIFFSRRVASKKSFVTTVAALSEGEGEYSKGSKSEGRSLKRLHRFQSDPRSTLPLHPSSPMESFPLSNVSLSFSHIKPCIISRSSSVFST